MIISAKHLRKLPSAFRRKIVVKDIVAIAPNRIDGESQGEKSYVDFDIAVLVRETEINDKEGNASLRLKSKYSASEPVVRLVEKQLHRTL